MKYNVETNKVETEITMVTNALEAMKKAEERKMANAKNYKKSTEKQNVWNLKLKCGKKELN